MGLATRLKMRPILFINYIILTLLGATTLFRPSPVFSEVAGDLLTYIWGGFILAGGILGVMHIVSNVWSELFGLPLLITSLSAYSVALIYSSLGNGNVPYSGIVVSAYALLLISRFADVVVLYRQALTIPDSEDT